MTESIVDTIEKSFVSRAAGSCDVNRGNESATRTNINYGPKHCSTYNNIAGRSEQIMDTPPDLLTQASSLSTILQLDALSYFLSLRPANDSASECRRTQGYHDIPDNSMVREKHSQWKHIHMLVSRMNRWNGSKPITTQHGYHEGRLLVVAP